MRHTLCLPVPSAPAARPRSLTLPHAPGASLSTRRSRRRPPVPGLPQPFWWPAAEQRAGMTAPSPLAVSPPECAQGRVRRNAEPRAPRHHPRRVVGLVAQEGDTPSGTPCASAFIRVPSPHCVTIASTCGKTAVWGTNVSRMTLGVHIKLSTPRKLLWHYRVATHTIMPVSKELPYDDHTTGGPCYA